MRHLARQVPESAVCRICEKGLLAPWKRLRQRRFAELAGAAPGAYPRVELVWFPYYLFSIKVNSRVGPGEMLYTVEAWSGAFAIFQLDEFLTSGARADEGDVFTHHLPVAECEESGRKDLLHTIMRQRSRSGGKPVPGEVTSRESILYPLWIYYYYRRKGVLDIRVVDAVSGQEVGHRTRAGVLQAFVAKESGGGDARVSGADAPG